MTREEKEIQSAAPRVQDPCYFRVSSPGQKYKARAWNDRDPAAEAYYLHEQNKTKHGLPAIAATSSIFIARSWYF